MKRVLLILLCLFIVVGCGKKEPLVTMRIKDNTLTNTSAIVIITDKNSKHYTYGEWFRIDYNKDNEWHKLETITDDISFYMIGYDIDKNNELEMETNWEWLYGKLKPGEYRLVKRVEDNTEIYAEFTIK